jgi:hypothetical protein
MLTSCTITVVDNQDYIVITQIKQINDKNERYEVEYQYKIENRKIRRAFKSYDFPVHSVGDIMKKLIDPILQEDLSIRALRLLNSVGIKTNEDLTLFAQHRSTHSAGKSAINTLFMIPGMGKRTAQEIQEYLLDNELLDLSKSKIKQYEYAIRSYSTHKKRMVELIREMGKTGWRYIETINYPKGLQYFLFEKEIIT